MKDLEEQASKVSTAAKNKFVDDLAALAPKADAIAARYQALANDAGVKAALAKLNTAAAESGPRAPRPSSPPRWPS